MDVTEVQEKKYALEKRIQEEIAKFEEECGINIFSITRIIDSCSYTPTQYGSLPIYKRPELEIHIEIHI